MKSSPSRGAALRQRDLAACCEQPLQRQTNVGWALHLDQSTAFTVDYVRVDGRDINLRFRAEHGRSPAAPPHAIRRRPNTLAFRAPSAVGESTYNGLIFGVRRGMPHGLDLARVTRWAG